MTCNQQDSLYITEIELYQMGKMAMFERIGVVEMDLQGDYEIRVLGNSEDFRDMAFPLALGSLFIFCVLMIC